LAVKPLIVKAFIGKPCEYRVYGERPGLGSRFVMEDALQNPAYNLGNFSCRMPEALCALLCPAIT